MRRFITRMRRAFRYGEKGFTLIELLIVVAILGILAAVIIPNVTTFMTTGTLNAANTEAENVKTAALAYFAEYGAWAGTSDVISTANFTVGNLRADYTFDANGLISDATPAANGSPASTPWSGITWQASSYKWIRG